MKFINENDKAYEIQLKIERLEDEIRELKELNKLLHEELMDGAEAIIADMKEDIY